MLFLILAAITIVVAVVLFRVLLAVVGAAYGAFVENR